MDPPAELVVSGPTSPAIPVRLTSGIAVDVIRSARESLLIASFAAYGITEIVAELRAASERNVRIDLLLEESTAAARAFGPSENKSGSGTGQAAPITRVFTPRSSPQTATRHCWAALTSQVTASAATSRSVSSCATHERSAGWSTTCAG